MGDLESLLQDMDPDEAATFRKKTIWDEGNVTAYVYQCEDNSNFRYLHEANTPEEFGEAAWKGLHDVMQLGKNAI